MGTFGGALEARHIDASNGKLTADVTGEVEAEDSVLVIRRIHVAMRLVAPEAVRETVERTHGIGKGNSRTHARHLRHALPPVSDAAQDDPTHFLF